MSIPGVREPVTRPERIGVEYYDQDWNLVEEHLEGLAARIVQHENDHLDGTMIPDHVPAAKRMLLHGKLRDIGLGKVPVDYKMKFRPSALKRRLVVFLVASDSSRIGGGRVELGLLKDIQALEQRAFEGEEMVPEVRSVARRLRRFHELHADDVCPGGVVPSGRLARVCGKFEQAVLQYRDLRGPQFDKRPIVPC